MTKGILSLILTFLFFGWGQAEQTSFILPHDCLGKISRIYADGKIEYTDRYSGTNCPLPSHNNRYVAYPSRKGLLIFDDFSSNFHHVLKLKQYGRDYEELVVNPLGWSTDSERLLYELSHGPENVFGGPDFLVPPENYGYYIYDLSTKNTSRIELPGIFKAFLPNDAFLLISKTDNQFETQLIWFKPGSPPISLKDYEGYWSDPTISKSNKYLIINYGHLEGKESSIMRIDIERWKAEPQTQPAEWATYHDPELSPESNRLSYIMKMNEKDNGEDKFYGLIIDGKLMYKCATSHLTLRHDWIDDNNLYLSGCSSNELIIFNAREGTIKTIER